MKTNESGRRKAHKGIAMEGIVARQYDRVQRNMIEQYRSWAGLVNSHAAAGSSILDVAPGPGYLLIDLAKQGSYELTGLDLSKTFVKIAQDKANKTGLKIDFRQGDAAEMPFPSETFDFVICTSAFKNFSEPVKVLDEIFRVLKSGGMALIIDMRKDAPKEKMSEFVNRMKLNIFDSYFVKGTFKSLARSAYTDSEVADIANRSRFGQGKIVDEDIGFELWLKK